MISRHVMEEYAVTRVRAANRFGGRAVMLIEWIGHAVPTANAEIENTKNGREIAMRPVARRWTPAERARAGHEYFRARAACE